MTQRNPERESSRIDICARCGEACEADDLVCNRCSETRIRATLPAEGLPASVEEGSLDDKLTRAEERAGERAHHIVASIEGTLGGEVTVHIAVVMAPEGPATPPEDIWSSPTPLTTMECGSSEVAATRMNWIDQTTTARSLAPAEVTRRYRVGTRGFRGDALAVGMLLDARLHMARRALGEETNERACSIEHDDSGCKVVADFTNKGTIELFSTTHPTPDLLDVVKAWIESR